MRMIPAINPSVRQALLAASHVIWRGIVISFELQLGGRILLLHAPGSQFDIYDALTTDRPYRKALPPEEAFAIMREEVNRGWWDGSLVDEFEALTLSVAKTMQTA